MIIANETFNSLVAETSRMWRGRFLIGEEVLSCDIVSVKVYKGACGDDFAIGSVYIPYLDATLKNCGKELDRVELTYQIGLVTDPDTMTAEYITVGLFTVVDPKVSSDEISFTAVGRLGTKATAVYQTTLGNAPVSSYLADIQAKMGIPIVLKGLTAAGSIEKSMNGLLYRDALGYIAGLLGGFVTEDNAGNVVIARYGCGETVSIEPYRSMRIPEFSEAEYKVTGIKVVVSEAGTDEEGEAVPEVSFTSGLPNVTVYNPYMTQSLFNSMVDKIVGFSFASASVGLALGDPRLEPWDKLSVIDLAGETHAVPCLQIAHIFHGGFESEIWAEVMADSAAEATTAGPISKTLQRVDAELFIAKQAILERVKAEDLEAQTAVIEKAIIGNGSANDFTVAKLSFIEAAGESFTADQIAALSAAFETATAETITAGNIKSAVAAFEQALANKLTADQISAGSALFESAVVNQMYVEQLEANYAHISNGKIDNATIDDAKVNNLNAHYAGINLANVNNAWIQNGSIKNASITDAHISSVSADKLTAGTIDASKIDVTNLNADNLTVGTINGQRIGNGSIDLEKLSEEVPTKEYLDNVQKNLQGQIDGQIETWTGTVVPTLNNAPASDWKGDSKKLKAHVGDIYYVVSAGNSADGYTYRFTENSNGTYSWTLIKDNQITKALQDIIDIQGDISGIKQFDSDISSWKTDTDSELSSLKGRATTLETEMGTKVSTSTFNEVKQTVDQNSSSIKSLSTSVSDAETRISNAETKITQNADAIALRATKTEVTNAINDIEVGGRNLLLNSSFTNDYEKWSNSGHEIVTEDGLLCGHIAGVLSTTKNISQSIFSKIKDDNLTQLYTVSADIKLVNYVAGSTNPHVALYLGGQYNNNGTNAYIGATRVGGTIKAANSNLPPFNNQDWVHVTYIFRFAKKPVNMYFYIYSRDWEGDLYYRNVKLERGNKATDWSPAPEDLENYADNAIETAKSEIEVTTDGISSEVSKINSIKYVTSSYNRPFSTIRSWAEDGTDAGNWIITSNSTIRVGDTVYVQVKDTTNNINRYVIVSVTAVNSATSIRGISHGYVDALPVDTIKSTINQSADSVKIQAKHVDIEGAAIFTGTGRLSTTSLDNAYDTNGAATAALGDAKTYVDGKGYQTATDVNTAITAKGYQTASDVESAIEAANNIWYATSSTAAGTAAKVATITPATTAFKLAIGTVVNVEFSATNSAAVANLTLSVNGTDAKAIKYMYNNARNNIPAVGYLVAGIVYQFMYDGDYWTIQNMHYNTDNNTNARQVQYYNTIVAGEALPTASMIGAHEDNKFYVLAGSGDYFMLSAPLLWLTTALNANATNYANIFTQIWDRNLATYYTSFKSGVANSMVYLKGTVSGNKFTLAGSDASAYLTCTEPTTEDGYFYIPIGRLGNQWNNNAYFNFQVATPVTLYAYIDGKFRQVTPTEIVSSQRIYYRSSVNTKPTAMPTAWVTETGNKYNTNATTATGWSTKVTPVASGKGSGVTKYLYLWTCEQRKRLDGTLAYTNVLLDDSTTIIDGGNIITGTVTANTLNASNINASGVLTLGAMSTAAQSDILNSNIEVGGRNLLREDPKQYTENAYNFISIPLVEALEAGVTYTLQLWGLELDENSSGTFVFWGGGTIRLAPSSGWAKPDANGYLKLTFTPTEANVTHAHAANLWINLFNAPSGHSGMQASIEKWKLERGNKGTDWSPAPEDQATLSDIPTNVTELEGVEDLATVSALQSVQADITGEIAGNQKNIKEIQGKITTVNSTLNSVSQKTNANEAALKDATEAIKTMNSMITLDPKVPEIVVSAGNNKVRITEDKIALMAGNNEVAYMDQTTLHITQAEIGDNMRVGDFKWITESNRTMLRYSPNK